jgi:hypothetical protein
MAVKNITKRFIVRELKSDETITVNKKSVKNTVEKKQQTKKTTTETENN